MIRCTLTNIDQIMTELIQEGGYALYSDIHKCIKYIWNKEKLPQQWNVCIIAPIYNKHGQFHGIHHSIVPRHVIVMFLPQTFVSYPLFICLCSQTQMALQASQFRQSENVSTYEL